ncbi:MAG: replicative DNA helicase [Mollicutes bacterium]|nr:replicative DNA helicase [Mollicutes bacterium]
MSTRKLPQNIDAEMEVLGAAFLTRYAFDKICEELSQDMFLDEKNKRIFEAIKNLYDKQTPLDVTTISNELDRLDYLKYVTLEYLAEVIDSVATAANVDYHINIVYEKALLRKLIDTSTSIITKAYDEKETAEDVVDGAEKAIFEVTKRRKAGEFQPISEVLRKVQDIIEQKAKKDQDVTGISSGFYDLDKMTSGFHENELIVLAARPGMGKTAIALNMAAHAALNSDKSVAFFSLEMGAEQLVTRLISSIGGIEGNKLKTGQLNHSDWKRFNEAMSELGKAKLFLEDASGTRVSDIRAKCRRLANSPQGLGLVIIDYLQIIEGMQRYAGNRQQEISEISRSLKIMAMELKVPVIALAQLSRNPEQRENKRPNLSDLRESGSIEQDADIVMFLYTDDYYDKERKGNDAYKMELIIGKQRNGGVGTIELLFEKNMSNFRNLLQDRSEKDD